VIAGGADDRANDGQLVHHGRQPREHFADLNARHSRGDGSEFASDFARRLGFDVPHVLVRRPAAQENVDHRLGPARPRAGRLNLAAKNIRERQRQAAKAKSANL
jgi:hypothetical protein